MLFLEACFGMLILFALAAIAGTLKPTPAPSLQPVAPVSLVVGDTVQLKAGGPPMVIEIILDGDARCVWFDPKKPASPPFREAFAVATLKRLH